MATNRVGRLACYAVLVVAATALAGCGADDPPEQEAASEEELPTGASDPPPEYWDDYPPEPWQGEQSPMITEELDEDAQRERAEALRERTERFREE